MPEVIVVAIVLVAIGAFVYWSPRRITVMEYERGLRYRSGKFVGLLAPGVHWLSGRAGKIVKVDTRQVLVTLPGQEVLTSDGLGVKISLVANVELVDPDVAINKVQNYMATFYGELQVALRIVVGGLNIEDLLKARDDLGNTLLERVSAPAAALGLHVISVNVRDVMLPGDLKRIFAQEVSARKEGLAALEKARGETAALRNLANAARLVQDNPALFQLRLLQQIGGTHGNTVVLGAPQIVPVPNQAPDRTKGSPVEPAE
jgi:regulator of protease activity HflC (stomatin/prohibitin superfamily)